MLELFVDPNVPQPLSKEETIELFYKMQAGDFNARQKLIEHNIRLVLNIVIKNFYSNFWEKQELVSVGIIGLIKSVDTFDITKGVNFSSYAIRCIENEILLFIRNNNKYQKNCSLDETLYSDDKGDIKLQDTLIDMKSDFVLDYENKEIYEVIRKIITGLAERKRLIVEMYFGFNNEKPMSQRDIANKLGTTQVSISRNLSKILKQISFILEQKDIIELSDSNTHNIRVRKRKRQ